MSPAPGIGEQNHPAAVSPEPRQPDKRAEDSPRVMSRGLPSIDEARRSRSKIHWMPPKFWAWTAVILGASFIVWWKKEEGDIQSMRNDLLARQRAVVAELGPRWFPLRDKIEAWTGECARGKDEVIDRVALRAWDFRAMPGIYLRLAQREAETAERIRAAAVQSLHDAFTSCLLVAPNPNPLAGPKCKSNKDCPQKQQCNEFEHCQDYAQPYNLRLGYKTMWPLSTEWVDDVQAIDRKLTMRGAVATFEDWNTYDLPVAVDLLTTAKYFLVVADEPAPGEPEPAPAPAASAAAPDAGVSNAIPSGPHFARICAWRLDDDRRVLSIRREAAGRLMGSGASADATSLEAQRRQANACALALSVRAAMGEDSAARAPE
jgi:hypothetical protein